ncbi:MAG: NYN domain-containing protein [Candidatus Omnitrophica bacterium]|jgi:predicted RNA-binding protein with PIN domain|nr:NYN domain-containing protein [Candidatus Omnitrophota bacterium]MDD5661171.1 NYN domain-containing protein [Candidatus Omnitrophota bacterium]
MSLQYIIDAYNLINHPCFKTTHPALNIQYSLADFIRINKLTGSKNNSVVLVFDGYPPVKQAVPEGPDLVCIFSRKLEADEVIKKIVEQSESAANIIVVSDDKEVQLASKLLHARSCGIEEFICGKKNNRTGRSLNLNASEPPLSYSAMQKINAELKKLWLD